MSLGVIILAAGKGKRMKSDLPKVLHEIDGRSMVSLVLDSLEPLNPRKTAVVVGNGLEQVISHLKGKQVVFCVQMEQLGTADAVKCAYPPFNNFEGDLLVLCGDTPLLKSETLAKLVEHHRRRDASATVLTSIMDDPAAYGRIVRDDNDDLSRIVEFKDADEETRNVHEVNTGTYVFKSPDIWYALEKVNNDNAQGEFYLTDAIEIFRNEGKTVAALAADNSDEVMGINTREQLEKAEKIYKSRIS